MLPPYPGSLPKGARLLTARDLSVGDLIFLESAASTAPVRSLIIKIRRNQFMVMNGLNPEPYEVHIAPNKQVWTLKQRPRRTEEELANDDGRAREPLRYSRYQPPPPEPEDYRKYWRWDPKDSRAQQEFSAVEEREWRRLRSWWEKKKPKARKPPPKAKPRPRIDDKTSGWYKLLRLRPGSSLKELKAAYKKAAFRYHPDRCKDSNAEEMFKSISEAYQKLLPLCKG